MDEAARCDQLLLLRDGGPLADLHARTSCAPEHWRATTSRPHSSRLAEAPNHEPSHHRSRPLTRVLLQLRHDPRTIALLLVVPSALDHPPPITSSTGSEHVRPRSAGRCSGSSRFLTHVLGHVDRHAARTHDRDLGQAAHAPPGQARPAARLRRRLRSRRGSSGDPGLDRSPSGCSASRSTGRRGLVVAARDRQRAARHGARSASSARSPQTEFQAVQFILDADLASRSRSVQRAAGDELATVRH